MQKMARLLSVFLVAILFLPACSRKQNPTPSGSGGSQTGGENVGIDGDIIPPGGPYENWENPDGLPPLRDQDSIISNGTYNGREMVEGIFPPVYFGFDSSSIDGSERTKLQQLAQYLEANSSYGVLIEGHCDWYGTAEYNLALGDRRAESVSNYLGTLGITPLRVDKLSKGSLEASTGISKSESKKDRRADLIILK